MEIERLQELRLLLTKTNLIQLKREFIQEAIEYDSSVIQDIDEENGIITFLDNDSKESQYLFTSYLNRKISSLYEQLKIDIEDVFNEYKSNPVVRNKVILYLEKEFRLIIVPQKWVFVTYPFCKEYIIQLRHMLNQMDDCQIPDYFAKMFPNIEVGADIINNSSHEHSSSFLPILKQKLRNPNNRSRYEKLFQKLYNCCIRYDIIDETDVPFQTFFEALVYAKTDKQIVLSGGAALHGFFLSKIMNIYNKKEFTGTYFAKQTRIVSKKLSAPRENTLYEYIGHAKSKYAKSKAMNKDFDDLINDLK